MLLVAICTSCRAQKSLTISILGMEEDPSSAASSRWTASEGPYNAASKPAAAKTPQQHELRERPTAASHHSRCGTCFSRAGREAQHMLWQHGRQVQGPFPSTVLNTNSCTVDGFLQTEAPFALKASVDAFLFVPPVTFANG